MDQAVLLRCEDLVDVQDVEGKGGLGWVLLARTGMDWRGGW